MLAAGIDEHARTLQNKLLEFADSLRDSAHAKGAALRAEVADENFAS